MDRGRVGVMQAKPMMHTTENCTRPVYGYRLEDGDVLQEGDLYDSTGGDWQPCPCPGLTLQSGNAAVWIRPVPYPRTEVIEP